MSVLNLYIPGLENRREDFELVKKGLGEQGIDNVINFYHKDRKVDGFFKSKEDKKLRILINYLMMAEENDINLIAQSCGCNEAAIILGEYGKDTYTNVPNIKSATLMSPVFVPAHTKVEKKISESSYAKYGRLYEPIPSLNIVRALKLYKYHLDFRQIALDSLPGVVVPIQFMMSDGDKYIFPEQIETMAREQNRELAIIESNSHNPLIGIGSNEATQKIKTFIEIHKNR